MSLLSKRCTCYSPALYSTLHRQYVRPSELTRAYCISRRTLTLKISQPQDADATNLLLLQRGSRVTRRLCITYLYVSALVFLFMYYCEYILLRWVLVTDGSATKVLGRRVGNGSMHIQPRYKQFSTQNVLKQNTEHPSFPQFGRDPIMSLKCSCRGNTLWSSQIKTTTKDMTVQYHLTYKGKCFKSNSYILQIDQ